MQVRKAGAIALTILSWVFRICALALAALVVALCFPGAAARLGLVSFVIDLSRALPSVIAGYGVIATPLGGAFRLDFSIVMVFLFLLDFACQRAARALR